MYIHVVRGASRVWFGLCLLPEIARFQTCMDFDVPTSTTAKPGFSTYRAPFWLPGGDLQTLYATVLRRPYLSYRRERWELPDGDFIDLDWLDVVANSPQEAPLVVLFHGLEGDSYGHSARFLMAEVRRLGWRGVVPHFRGCSGESNRLPRAYHSGDSAEIGYILNRLRQGAAPMFAVGVSLGGNALLKWLGEQGAVACEVVKAAATVSAPLDLPAAGAALDQGFARVYTAHFLNTLKRKALAKLERFPGLYDRKALLEIGSIEAFDTLVTAPLHGYRDAADYWRQSASKPWLTHIRVPTLVINARNDPFMPGRVLPEADEVSAQVTLDFPAQGGHVGFVSGAFPGRFDWLPGRVMGYLAGVAAAR